jgi:hypothetical protein
MNVLAKSWLGVAVSVCVMSMAAISATDPAKERGKQGIVEAEAIAQSSAELSAELGKKWGAVLTQGYGVSGQGLKMFVDGYASYPKEVLKNALEAKNFEAMNRTLMDHNQNLVNALAEKIRSDADSMDPASHKFKADVSKALGDEARDLVYIPITPCRTFDTRSTAFSGTVYSGPVSPGNPKAAYVYFNTSPSSWIAYGGTVDSCPDTTVNGPLLGGAAPYSVAFNLGIVGPVGSGWVTVYRADLADQSAKFVSQLVVNGVNDTALVVANVCRGATGASCDADIRISSGVTTVHVAGDVVGYFIRPQSTALNCQTVSGTAISVPANTYQYVGGNTPACPTGFSSVSLDFAASADVLRADADATSGALYVRNVSSNAQNVFPKRTCCRIAGR